DLNNLLSPIIGISEIAMKNINIDHPHYARFNQIHATARTAAELTKRLLAFSKKQTLEMRVVSLRDEMLANQAFLRRLVREEISLIYEVGECRCDVRIDTVQLLHVLMNLLINAADAI